MQRAMTLAAAGPIPVVTNERPFLTATDQAHAMVPAPLPQDWVLHGDPSPRIRILTSSRDAVLMSGIWECRAGTFDFHYDFDETVHLISGGVRVTMDGVTEELGPGSVAYFARGSVATWEVADHVHKYFVQRNPARPTRMARRFVAAVRKLVPHPSRPSTVARAEGAAELTG